MNSPAVYFETQSFLRHWWALLMVPIVLAAVPLALQLGGQWPISQSINWVSLATALFIAFLLLTLRLEIRLDETGVHYRLAPLHRSWRHKAWTEISRVQVRSYDPLGEYGGWGLKGTSRNRALNIAGSEGLQLELRDGTRLLLGTQRPAELRQALTTLNITPAPTA